MRFRPISFKVGTSVTYVDSNYNIHLSNCGIMLAQVEDK